MIFIFNVGPHYNFELYKLIDESFDCEFYIGNKLNYSIKLFEYGKLNCFKKRLINIFLLGEIYWQWGVIAVLFKRNRTFILTGDPYCLTNWLILIVNRILGRKTILWTHGMYGDERGIKEKLKLFFLSLASGILLYGERGRQILLGYNFQNKKLNVIYNSTNYSDQLFFRKRAVGYPIFKNPYPVLLFVGRITKRKKVQLLVDAFENLNTIGVRCNLLIIGDFENGNANYLSFRSEHFKNQVKHFDGCYNEEILSNYFKVSDITVVPGDVGLLAIQSLTYGVPVITHDFFESHGPEYEVINVGLTGDFFRKDNLTDLINVISKWILILSENREIIKTRCFQAIENNYNPASQIRIMRKIYEENKD